MTGKADRLIAERAQRQRKEAKLAYRRTVYKDSLDQVIEEERLALMKKHSMSGSTTSHSNAGAGGLSTAHSSQSRMSTGGAPMTPAAIAAMAGSNAINMSMF